MRLVFTYFGEKSSVEHRRRKTKTIDGEHRTYEKVAALRQSTSNDYSHKDFLDEVSTV